MFDGYSVTVCTAEVRRFGTRTSYRSAIPRSSQPGSPAQSEIAILVASLLDLMRAGLSVLYTDRHAFLMTARFFDLLDNLDQIDWRPLRNRDFKRDNNDPGKIERYQAEALVHRHLPVGALRAILCYSENQRKRVEGWAAAATCSVPILTRRSFYF